MKETMCENLRIHTMRLQTDPFLQIKCGKKRVELRLADEKRGKLRIGDLIIFEHTKNAEETLCARVTDLRRYGNFDQVQKDFCLAELGFSAGDESLGERMRIYYSDTDVQKYGVLAICIEQEN